jgi:hypothetical protein
MPKLCEESFSCDVGLLEWFAAITPTATPAASGIAIRLAISAGRTLDVRRHTGPRLNCIRLTSVSAPNAL